MRRLATLVAACCCVAALAGCTQDDPQPNYSSVNTSPTATPSPSPTANHTINVQPGAVEPTPYSDATSQTSDGAFSFAAYYWKMVDWAYATNDGSVLHDLYASTCKSCAAFETNIDENTAYGYDLIGGHIAVQTVSVATTDGVPAAQHAFDVKVAVDELKVNDKTGRTINTFPAVSDTQRVYVSWVGAGWKVVDTAKVTS